MIYTILKPVREILRHLIGETSTERQSVANGHAQQQDSKEQAFLAACGLLVVGIGAAMLYHDYREHAIESKERAKNKVR